MEGFYIINCHCTKSECLTITLHLSLLKYLLNDVKKACIWNFRVNMILRQDVWLTALEYPQVGEGGGGGVL